MGQELSSLRFNGSVWCNLDIALRNMDQVFNQCLHHLGLTVIEWYVMRSLFENDGQNASALAHAVGRAATSFTPNLDKLQQKGFVERQADKSDRRAVRIYLTEKAHQQREEILQIAAELDKSILSYFGEHERTHFESVLLKLQSLTLD